MANREARGYELNEVSWWAKWADETIWLSKNSYAMFSRVFKDEWFYNRGAFLGVERVPVDAVEAVEGEFAKRKRDPSIMVEEGRDWEKLRAALASKGYVATDRMLVLESEAESRRRSASNPKVEVVLVEPKSKALGPEEWTRTYLQAFYGDQRLNKEVNKIIRKVVSDKKSSLVLAMMGDATAGCAALYRTAGGVVGAYCIGTVPRFRDKGVAAAMLKFMRELAKREKRILILQTMASDAVEDVYLKNGFKLAYSKTLFEKRPEKRVESATLSGETFGVVINRRAADGRSMPFTDVFSGFEMVGAVRRLFGSETEEVISKLKISMDPPVGYLRVDGGTGNVIINPEYLKTGHETHLYLDVIHELTHVKQFREGKELYDRRFAYFERPTEIEAYVVAVEEARRIGLDREEIVEYLRVDWVTEKEFASFVAMMQLSE